ncbi:MAG: tRNA (adenosine(37)-N6)-threonylcarbamoyltransferase complex dimerization subunit type 1 TsaB [Melioribacteraceae bacterium]|nr:tRNA (adenosine(37)-N6)-threonylcarbamoyltransferase complex dimerization subunit type 1 TsaB [Melioribacteraceae bacterium]
MNKFKPILGIETSEELCSVAVMLTENSFIELNYKQKYIHSEKLILMIDELLKMAELKINEIGHIAVSIGPGSFTGLRIGLSAAKGIALGASLPIVPAPTFEALALQISAFIPDGEEFIIVNKVNISELYFLKVKKDGKLFRVTDELKLLSKTEYDKLYNTEELVFGNYKSGNELLEIASPNAEYVAKWSYIFGQDLVTYNYDYLEPNYLKKFVAKVKK